MQKILIVIDMQNDFVTGPIFPEHRDCSCNYVA